MSVDGDSGSWRYGHGSEKNETQRPPKRRGRVKLIIWASPILIFSLEGVQTLEEEYRRVKICQEMGKGQKHCTPSVCMKIAWVYGVYGCSSTIHPLSEVWSTRTWNSPFAGVFESLLMDDHSPLWLMW